MYGLPFATHRSLIEPLTEVPHMSRVIAKRYISFINKIKETKKESLKMLLDIVELDTRTTTGHNLRKLMIQTNSETVSEMLMKKSDFQYFLLDSSENWKINMLKEIIDVKHDEVSVAKIDDAELEDILVFLCTS